MILDRHGISEQLQYPWMQLVQ